MNFFHVFVISNYTYVFVWMCACDGRGQKLALDPTELELHIVMNHQTWVLETKLRSLARVISPVLCRSNLLKLSWNIYHY